MSTRTGTMQDYVNATKLCDSDNPWLYRVAEEIVKDARTPEERALSIFYHARDAVRFSLAYSRSTASQTLKRGYGECGNKTNAQVALLRALGIPARFRWVQARSQALHHLIADFVYRNMPPVASHFWCECFLSGEWVSCKLMLDKPLYEGMLQEGLITKEQVPAIDWDGKTDLVLLNPWITENRGHLPSFDDAISVLQASEEPRPQAGASSKEKAPGSCRAQTTAGHSSTATGRGILAFSREEGMPPLWIEWIIAPLFYRLNRRYSDRIRQLASG